MEVWMKKRILLFIGVITFLLLFIVLLFSDIIFQEGNPILVIKGIQQLQKKNVVIIQFSNNPIKYIMKNDKKDSKKYPLLMPGTGHEVYIDNKINQGWEIESTHGSSFILTKDNTTLNVFLRMFTQDYIIIEEKYN